MWKKLGRAAAVAAACLGISSRSEAQGRVECDGTITRSSVVPCAVAASLDVRTEQTGVVALEGRRTASGIFLPTNPVLAVSAAQRAVPSESALNGYVTLSQELEIAGQRGRRVRAANAALAAQEKRLLLSKRDAAVFAWFAFFESIAAREELRLAERLLATSERMGVVVHARAEKGLAAPLDTDLADAANVRLLQGKLMAERAALAANARLALALGRDPSTARVVVEGELTPLAAEGAHPSINLAQRPEVQAADAERNAALSRAEALRRARVPNPTISVFAQNDGFNERVLGLGIAIPIPLPAPVGRTYAGEIVEADALAERAAIDRTRVERELQLAVADASAAYDAHRAAVAAMTPERRRRAEYRLEELQAEIEAGRLGVREVLVAQQTLIELLQTDLAERRALCLASVELARALGVPLEGGVR